MFIMSNSGIFYNMRMQCLNDQTFKLFLVAVAFVALAAIACNGSPANGGSPSTEASPVAGQTPLVKPSPGSGYEPIQAILSYGETTGFDGLRLDANVQTDCPLTDLLGTPGVASTMALGQFCVVFKDVAYQKATTAVLQLPDTGESWEMKLELDSEDSLWKVTSVNKVGG
jgi:hypothetical protein